MCIIIVVNVNLDLLMDQGTNYFDPECNQDDRELIGPDISETRCVIVIGGYNNIVLHLLCYIVEHIISYGVWKPTRLCPGTALIMLSSAYPALGWKGPVWCTSGVCSCPYFFNMFVNDIPLIICDHSQSILFADDLKLFRMVWSHGDALLLQEDLERILVIFMEIIS